MDFSIAMEKELAIRKLNNNGHVYTITIPPKIVKKFGWEGQTLMQIYDYDKQEVIIKKAVLKE